MDSLSYDEWASLNPPFVRLLTYLQRIVQSPVLRFLVGNNQTSMTIHKALVTEQASGLRDCVSGPMREAESGTITWDEVDEATFGNFAQFLYTGDYTPVPIKIEDTPKAARDDNNSTDLAFLALGDETFEVGVEPEIDQGWGNITSGGKPMKRYKRKIERLRHHSNFHALDYPRPASCNTIDPYEIRLGKSLFFDYRYVFLSHARLYALAEKYGFERLKALVLHKLHRTMRNSEPPETCSQGLIDLLSYIYENTPSRPKIDGLRELMVRYIAMEARQIATSQEFLQLVKEKGEIASDLLPYLLEKDL